MKTTPTFRHENKLGPVIAVIGHGRSPERHQWGFRIDRVDTCIRMWDCAWQAPESHGRRYDIGFFEIHAGMVEIFLANKRREPRLGWVASLLTTHRINPNLPERTEVIQQAPWNDIGRKLGGVGATGRLEFTRGTVATCWAIGRAETGDEIVLVGFDNIQRGKTLPLNQAFSPVYQQNPGTFSFADYAGNVTKAGNHDFAVELPVMRYLAAQRGVTLTFASDVWGC